MRKIKITNELREVLQGRTQAFRKKFGREPGDDDPLFFDPNSDEPRFQSETQLKDKMCAVMIKARIDPALIYAFLKTGRILTAENKHCLTRAELKEWHDATEEFHKLQQQRSVAGIVPDLATAL
jgi:hypothetical protein